MEETESINRRRTLMKKDLFGDRMKEYEQCGELVLPQNIPIIIRLDGNSFSKLTKKLNFKKPFDDSFREGMEAAMKEVMDYTGAKIGYCQSDEITLLIVNPLSQKFLSNRISKICSLVASNATNGFNKYFIDKDNYFPNACFDCRVFVVPEKEVNNVFLWRQKDAWKNAVYAYAFFEILNQKKISNRKATSILKNMSLNEKREFIKKELNFDIDALDSKFKIGFCMFRKKVKIPVSELPKESQKHIKDKKFIERNQLYTDLNIPLFNEKHEYIEQFL